MARSTKCRLKLLPCAMLLMNLGSMTAQHAGVDSPMPVTLDLLRDRYRPVLVFAPSATRTFLQQIRILAQGGVPMHERNLVTVPILLHQDNKPWGVVFNGNDDIGQMPAAEQDAARRRFGIPRDKFAVILIGKDGDEKLRSYKPISLDILRDTIDAMPMRQEEMRKESGKPQ